MNIQYLSLLVLEHRRDRRGSADRLGEGKVRARGKKAMRWDPICCPSDIQSMAYVPKYVDIYFSH